MGSIVSQQKNDSNIELPAQHNDLPVSASLIDTSNSIDGDKSLIDDDKLKEIVKASKSENNLRIKRSKSLIELNDAEQSISTQVIEATASTSAEQIPKSKRAKTEQSSLVQIVEKEETNGQTSDEDEEEIETVTLAPYEKFSAEQIDNMYPVAAEFIKNNVFIKGNGFELVNNSLHVYHHHNTKYWKICTDTEVQIISNSYDKKIKYHCPLNPCDFVGPRGSLTINHIPKYHGPIKYMCPFVFPQHVVPIIALNKAAIQQHIFESHGRDKNGKFSEPILMHTRQIHFPFTMLASNSKYKTLAAELCFTKERELAMKIIKEKGIKNTQENRWKTLNDLPKNHRCNFFVRSPHVLNIAEASPY